MAGGKWEVCLCADSPSYEIWCRKFRSYRRARRFMRKNLSQDKPFYCAIISNDENSAFETFYWNGEEIISWDKPWVLSRRQAEAIKD